MAMSLSDFAVPILLLFAIPQKQSIISARIVASVFTDSVARIDFSVQIGNEYSFILLRIRSLVFGTDVHILSGMPKATDVISLKAFSSGVIATIYLSLYRAFGVISRWITSSTISLSLLTLKTSLVSPSLQLNVPSVYSFRIKPITNADRLHGMKPYGATFNASKILLMDARPLPFVKPSLIIPST